MDIADADRDGDENFKLGMGIMERLGGRACGERASPGVSRPEVEEAPSDPEKVGDMTGPSPSENDRHWIEGAGILLGVFGRARGGVIFTVAGVFGCERDGGRTGGAGAYPVREDERTREGGLVNIDDWVTDGIEDWVIGDHGREEDMDARETLLR